MTDPPSVTQLSSTRLTFSNSTETATLPSNEVRTYSLPTPDDSVELTGQLIGYASSQRFRHSNHPNTHAAKGEKCPACRWFEARIFRLQESNPSGVYAVHTQGPSLVPDEIVKCRLSYAQSGYEVVELLTVRRVNEIFLPAASSRALSQAAAFDEGIETAYVNRAV